MAGDVAESGRRGARALAIGEQAGADVPPEVVTTLGNYELFEGRLEEAAAWYRRARGSGRPPNRRNGCSSPRTELLRAGLRRRPDAPATGRRRCWPRSAEPRDPARRLRLVLRR